MQRWLLQGERSSPFRTPVRESNLKRVRDPDKDQKRLGLARTLRFSWTVSSLSSPCL